MKKLFGMSVLVVSIFAVLTVFVLGAAPACSDIIGGCIDVGSTYAGSEFFCNEPYCKTDVNGPDLEKSYFCQEWWCSGEYRYNNRTVMYFCGTYCSSIK